MNSSESIKNLTKALLKAQTQMGAAVKGAKNPFFKSTYADLPTVMEVVKGPLNEAGVLVLQPACFKDGKNFITTTLIHAETGEWTSSDTEVICSKQNDPQAFGAAQTYARRFGLQSMLFIPAEDDDGNFASGRTSKQEDKKEETKPMAATAAPTSSEAPKAASSSFKKTSSFRKSTATKAPTTPAPAASETDANEWA